MACNFKNAWICIGSLAVILAAAYAFLVYPKLVGDKINVAVDGHDRLGFGLYEYGTLSYYPDNRPTVMRGPLYPALIAVILSLHRDSYPYNIQFAQALLHGLTCLLVFGAAAMLMDRRRAVIASLVCAVHPYLIWYSGRIVVESLSIFLFTALSFCIIHFHQNPASGRAVAAGCVLGASALCKTTYVPFILLLPLLLCMRKEDKMMRRYAIIIFFISAAIVAPWTVRNFFLTGKFLPVHALAGFNFHVGDSYAKNYWQSPLAYAKLVDLIEYDIGKDGKVMTVRWLEEASSADGIEADNQLMAKSLKKYIADPMFFLRKIGRNALMFWTLSSSKLASLVTILMQIPLLACFTWGAMKFIKRHGARSGFCIPLWLVSAYFLFHLPIAALARYSVVLIPAMVMYAVYLVRSESNGPAMAL
jgi:4-amino-4-deoxy-L-arabinose transferase-like glycosyltransferase